MSEPVEAPKPFAVDVVMQAAARLVMSVALDVIQADPHYWSSRPCVSCRTVTALVGRPFGCDLHRRLQEPPG